MKNWKYGWWTLSSVVALWSNFLLFRESARAQPMIFLLVVSGFEVRSLYDHGLIRKRWERDLTLIYGARNQDEGFITWKFILLNVWQKQQQLHLHSSIIWWNQRHLVGRGLEAMFISQAKEHFNGKFSGYKAYNVWPLPNQWLMLVITTR